MAYAWHDSSNRCTERSFLCGYNQTLHAEAKFPSSIPQISTNYTPQLESCALPTTSPEQDIPGKYPTCYFQNSTSLTPDIYVRCRPQERLSSRAVACDASGWSSTATSKHSSPYGRYQFVESNENL